MSDAIAHIHTDGAARGNPGPAAWAFVIERPGHSPIEAAERFGEATNNVAEYTALIRAMERASQLGLRRVAIFSDSELMVKQMNGEYAVKNRDLRDLYDQAQSLRRKFDSATLAHVRRAANARTDKLCNAALDGRPLSATALSPGAKAAKKPQKKARRADLDAEAIECLRAAARSWGATQGADPSPELVWDQLWSILAEAGLVKAGH